MGKDADLVVIAGDHVEAFFFDAVPALAVYVGAECTGSFGPYRYRFAIHEPLARAVLEEGIERGFDLLYTQDARLDYAFYVPLHFTMADRPVPIVPLHVNVYLPPQPTPRRCYDWGRALGEILRARPERVVLMASGGMSHFPGTDRYASPDVDFDRDLLNRLEAGRGAELAALTGVMLMATAEALAQAIFACCDPVEVGRKLLASDDPRTAPLFELVAETDPERSDRVMRALLQMKKLDLEALRRA